MCGWKTILVSKTNFINFLFFIVYRIAEMEETHQEVVLKLREDMKREEEKHISRAVAQVRSEEEEKQREMMHEFKQKERERIQAAVDAERKIMESQHGSVTQLQQVLNFKNTIILFVVPPKF